MGYLRFSLVLFIFSFSAWSQEQLLDRCLKLEFSEQVAHKVKPFGLLKNKLEVIKNKCVITIKSTKYKYLKKQWIVDVCREPIHIKFGTDAVDVFKRQDGCLEGTKRAYCSKMKKLLHLIEDDGLIFAKGEREDLATPHGHIYCAFLLLNAYLDNGSVFSRYHQSPEYVGVPQKSESLPITKQQDKKTSKTEGVSDTF